jgi:hypothetical protein
VCKNDVRFSVFSCQRICIIKETGLVDDEGAVDVMAVIKFFHEPSSSDLSPKWEPTVRNSIKSCEKECPGELDTSDEKKLSNCYRNLVECARKANFVNCPSFSATGDCGKMRELMAKCERKHFEFLHKILFEEIFERGNWKPETTTTGKTTSGSGKTTGGGKFDGNLRKINF